MRNCNQRTDRRPSHAQPERRLPALSCQGPAGRQRQPVAGLAGGPRQRWQEGQRCFAQVVQARRQAVFQWQQGHRSSRAGRHHRRARRAAKPVLCRWPPQAAGGAAGHRHLGQGRHGARRVCTHQPAGRAHRGLEGPHRKRARPRLPLAHPPADAGRRRDDGVQPQPLRRRAGAGGQRLDHAAADRCSATRTSTTSSACWPRPAP